MKGEPIAEGCLDLLAAHVTRRGLHWVENVDAHFDQVGNDGEDIAVGMMDDKGVRRQFTIMV